MGRTEATTLLKMKCDPDHELSHSSDGGEDAFERQLSDVTFGELQKAKTDGSCSVFRKLDEGEKTGRGNKNRPSEFSCRNPVGRFRDVIQAPKKVARDPRFESLYGRFDSQGFRKRYDFLFERVLPTEREKLKAQLKKAGDAEAVDQLKNHISWIDKQAKLVSVKQLDQAILADHKKKEREAARKGKQPFYLKKSEVRKRRLIDKYAQLKASGQLESFMEKRRKRNASRDHVYLPRARP